VPIFAGLGGRRTLARAPTPAVNATSSMSAFNLDKGLDEIIASKGISAGGRKPRGVKKSRGKTSTKTLASALAAAKTAKAEGKKPVKGAKTAAAKARPAAVTPVANPLAQAKRAVVSNMPLDVNEDAVKQYFSANVGKVRKVDGHYREDGRPTGTYTLVFEKPGKAQVLLEKFHNQPVDGGKSHMAVQILLDATVAAPPTLAGRIGGSAEPAPSAAKRRPRGKKAADGPVKAVKEQKKQPAKKAAAKPGKAAAKKPKAKNPKRSVADLDAEMSDYFAKADQNEISV